MGRVALIFGVALFIGAGFGSANAAEALTPTTVPVLATVKLRVGDLQKALAFYKDLFGLREVTRYDTPYPPGGPGLVEVALQFGVNDQEAKINKGTGLTLMFRPDAKTPYQASDVLPNFIIHVPDMDMLAKHIAEGKYALQMAPFQMMPGVMLAMVKDPSGNVVECIQMK